MTCAYMDLPQEQIINDCVEANNYVVLIEEVLVNCSSCH